MTPHNRRQLVRSLQQEFGEALGRDEALRQLLQQQHQRLSDLEAEIGLLRRQLPPSSGWRARLRWLFLGPLPVPTGDTSR